MWFLNRILIFRNRPAELLKKGDIRLSTPCVAWDFDKTTKSQREAIVRKLRNTLLKQTYGQRLGIAAPQIGVNKRVIIVLGKAMFNPTWRPVKSPMVDVTEGCYSLEKDAKYLVTRAKYGWAEWRDVDGDFQEGKLNELEAIVFQHEFSHLEGKCCDQLGTKID